MQIFGAECCINMLLINCYGMFRMSVVLPIVFRGFGVFGALACSITGLPKEPQHRGG